ncbi:membrane protein insertion efficiency factor YidD [Eubacteriaceae bacterium ES3]|nr:membrane protein insertion efficiency factor YidD [Eubacteriaceae bacterium ES3]
MVKKLIIIPVRIYQRFISPLLGNNCRFRPTCSEYFIGAVEKYGVFKGVYLGVRRILRCHPFNPGGYDPLP